jgi:pimeloyl-ACP methyl ester carboxylesterase
MAEIDGYRRAVAIHTCRLQKEDRDCFLKKFDENKETVIFLPGGMGSELRRAKKPFEEGASDYAFDRIWLDKGFLTTPPGDGRALEISRNGRDLGNRIIVADEDTTFLNVRPYVRAMRFFRSNRRRGAKFNAVFLAWDWRRDLLTAVCALHDVIKTIKEEKAAAGSNNPQQVMKNIFIVGHSMGGMVAKLFFQRHQASAAEIGGMISVGTPFYGYFQQLRHVFEGEKLFNKAGVPDRYGAKAVAQITASLPGLYTLFPIDKETYNRVGKTIGLKSYPVTSSDGKTPADAYDKDAPSSRWPPWIRIDELQKALCLRREIAAELPKTLRDAVFHIRVSKEHSTPATATWDQSLPPDYDPSRDPSPIKIKSTGPGDETIPYWSAALAGIIRHNPGNVTDFAEGQHMSLMAQNFVLRDILRIVSRGSRSIAEKDFIAEYGPDPQMATAQELETFLSQIDLEDPQTIRDLETLMPESIAWRFLQEIAPA